MKDTLQFILAGNALFTVENAETGNRFTFKVRKPDDDKPHFSELYHFHWASTRYARPGGVHDKKHDKRG